jgi:hypothetical protein
MSSHREQWRPVLEAESKRWSAMSYEQLIAALADDQVYEIELESRKYQVEVELLENTEKYIHVTVSVDDGTLPASIWPLTFSFIRHRDSEK